MTRFLKKRTDQIAGNPELSEAVKKVLAEEEKVLKKVRKKAKGQNIEISEIHTHLILYAMREHIRNTLMSIDKKHFLPKK